MEPVSPRGSTSRTPPDAGDSTSLVRTIGRYHLLEELGRGAMGIVYKGFDPIIGRTVALKTIIFTESDAETRELKARLYREAGAAGTLSHPNIVTIYDVIEEGKTSAVAMEFIEGTTLASVIEEKAPLALEEAMALFEQICAALDYAGSRGIVHRDIKPANIMVTPAGKCKVADFGVARMVLSNVTQHGVIIGSPSYMSPEQVKGSPLDARSDMFSGTIVLYELLTGARPFPGDDLATTMFRIVHEAPKPANQVNPALSPRLNAIFEKALAKEPDKRYQSGADLLHALRAALPGIGQGSAVAIPAPIETPAAPAKKNLPMLVGVGVLAVALVSGLAIWARGLGGSSPLQTTQIQTPGTAAVPAPSTGTTAGGSAAAPAANAPTGTAAVQPPAAGSGTPVAPAPPAAPAIPTGTLQARFAGQSFPIRFTVDGKRFDARGGIAAVPAGRVRVRASSDAAFFERDFGVIDLKEGARHAIALPRTTGATINVADGAYEGLQISVGGRSVAKPYPAQIRQIVEGSHQINFRWTSGPNQGKSIRGTATLVNGEVFRIVGSPKDDRVTVTKLR